MLVEKMSWSRENLLEKCGQQFAYRYGENIRIPPAIAMIRGRGPHASAEADLVSKMETGELLPTEAVIATALDEVETTFKGEVTLDGDFAGLSLKAAKGIVRDQARGLALVHHERVAPIIKPAAVEVRLVADIPAIGVPYEGVLDVVDDRDGGEWIDDLKTKVKAPNADFAETSEQLTIYDALYRSWKGKPPAGLAFDVIWMTPGGKTNARRQDTSRTDADLEVRFARTRKNIDAIEKEIFLPAPVDSWQCSERWCGYWNQCPFARRGASRPTS